MSLSDNQPSLLDAIEANGATSFRLDRWWCSGKTPSETPLDELVDRLNVQTKFDSETRHVFVTDFGIGVEARHYEQIFRMFNRLHGRDEFGGGVGPGLTIFQKLIQRHGGCVWLDSIVGVGTTFYCALPCGDEAAI
jgi:light-regulated signal transduction histidine kinase (bacteriophytochrome)